MHGIRTGRIEFLAGRKKRQEALNPECTNSAEIAEEVRAAKKVGE
jgi:hypothetical protein